MKKNYWEKRLGSPEGVENWHTYSYEYLDDLSFMQPAKEVLKDWPEGEKIVQAVSDKLIKRGWEGDGEMQLMWFPPFAGVGPDNNYGCFAFHVKQLNDGISWIACPYSLPFHRLFEPSDSHYLPAGKSRMESTSWRTGATEWNAKFIGYLDSEFDDENS